MSFVSFVVRISVASYPKTSDTSGTSGHGGIAAGRPVRSASSAAMAMAALLPAPMGISRAAKDERVVAIGEIGLDFYYRYSAPEKQIQVFRRQLRTAQELDLPVIIHSRLAQEAVLTSIAEEGYSRGGVVHCFTESRDFANHMVEKGFYISFSGIVTFPKARDIQETACGLPPERLLVETDSPYLVPSPYRGKVKRNEPMYVRDTARFLADLKGISQAQMAKACSENFSRCFGFEFTGY